VLDAKTKDRKPRAVPLPPAAAREAAGLPHVRFHDVRHTYASWLVQQGQPLAAVRDLLGHSSLAVTSRYSHLAPEHLKKAVAGLKLRG
jgi:site-specific recombinase XerD